MLPNPAEVWRKRFERETLAGEEAASGFPAAGAVRAKESAGPKISLRPTGGPDEDQASTRRDSQRNVPEPQNQEQEYTRTSGRDPQAFGAW